MGFQPGEKLYMVSSPRTYYDEDRRFWIFMKRLQESYKRIRANM